MRRRATRVALVVGSLVTLVVAVHFYVVLDEAILWYVALGAVGVSAILAPFLIPRVKSKSSDSPPLRTPLLRLGLEALILVGIVCPLSLAATLFANCFRDPSEAQVLPATVLRRRVQENFLVMKTYSVILTTRLSDLPRVFAYVDYRTFQNVSRGDRVQLSLKQGRLGARWVFDVTLLAARGRSNQPRRE